MLMGAGHNLPRDQNMPFPVLRTLRHRPLTAARTLFDLAFEQFARHTRVLFVMSDAYGFACQAPVIRELRQFPDLEVKVTTDKPRDPKTIELENAADSALFHEHYLSPSRARFTKWHMVVDTHINGFYPAFNALRVYMHHGPGYGNTGNKNAVAERYEIFCGLSEMERDWLNKLYPGLFGQLRVFFPVGFPKSDALYQKRFDRGDVLSKLNLPNRTTILITSHWQKQGILRYLSDGPLRKLALAFPDYNIIQTGHPWLWQNNHNIPEEWRKDLLNQFEELGRRYGNVRFVQTSNVETLLCAADLLVGDSSSVMTTYSLMDRPIVFFDNPSYQFATPELKQIFMNASHPFSRMGDLVCAAREALSNPEIKAEGRAQMRSAFYAHEGRSAAYMAGLIRSIGHVSSVYSPAWNEVVELANNQPKA